MCKPSATNAPAMNSSLPDTCSNYRSSCNSTLLSQSHVEAELLESERKLASLLGNLPGLAYRCLNDPDWTMVFISAGCYDLTGYHAEDLLQKQINYNELIDEPYQKLLWDKWQTVLAAGTQLTEEYTITTATGAQKWVWEQGRGVYDPTGEVVALEGIIMDITDKKLAEESARRRLDELVYMSYHDKLTGLHNRAFLDEEMARLDQLARVPIGVIMGDVNGLKITNDMFGHQAGDMLLITISQVLQTFCRSQDTIARWGGNEFVLLLPGLTETAAGELCVSIRDQMSNVRQNHIVPSISLGYAAKTSPHASLQETLKIAEDRMLRRKLLENKSMHSATMKSLREILFSKSSETEEHGSRIADLCYEMSHHLGLGSSQHDEMRLLGLLHDIGKVGIQDSILQKPGPLTAAEWVEMKKHPAIGCRIAQSIYELAPIAEYILSHHERWDGTGYPQGLQGEAIPLLVRLLAVADAYDAMTQPRPYRAAMSSDAAVAEIVRCSGTQFDPAIVDAFLAVMAKQ